MRTGFLSLLVASGALFAFAAPAMAAPPVFGPAPGPTVETEGPGGYELNLTATDDTDPSVDITCAPFDNGDTVPVGGPHAITCTATDDSADPAVDTTPLAFNLTVTDTQRSDLQIEKFASHLKASPGQHITYTFEVTNHGPDDAPNTVVRDPLSQHFNFISGDPGCTLVPGGTGSELVCNFGTVPDGATQTKSVVLQLHPSHHQGEPPNQHQLDVLKIEGFVSPTPGGAEPYFKHSMSCPGGYTAVDGSARTDSVDQGTGTRPGEHDVENLHVVRSESNAADRAQWDFSLQNHATGQAQVHLFVVCLRDTLSSADGHDHDLFYNPQVTGTLIIPASGGRFETTRTCPVGFVAVAPSFEFRKTTAPFGEDGPHGPQYKSEQSADGRSWTFGFQTAAAARVETSIRCLRRTTSTDNGHFETLQFHHAYSRAEVGAFQGFGSSGPWTEARQECPVHYKGIVATWDFPRHVKPMGNTPEPINRDFRIFNKSPHPKFANIDLLCLKIVTHDDLNGGSVQNNASVYSDLPDWHFGNNLDFWVLEDPPLLDDGTGDGGGDGAGGGGDGSGSGSGGGGGGSGDGGGSGAGGAKLGLRLGDAVTPAGKTAMVPMYGGDDASSGEVSLDKGKKHYGSADFDLDAGEDAYVDVKLNKKGRKKLKKSSSVAVTVDTGDGSSTQTLRVAR